MKGAALCAFNTIPSSHQQLLGEKDNPGARALPTSLPRGTTAIPTGSTGQVTGNQTATAPVGPGSQSIQTPASCDALDVIYATKPFQGKDPCRNNRIYKKPTHRQPNLSCNACRRGPRRRTTQHPPCFLRRGRGRTGKAVNTLLFHCGHFAGSCIRLSAPQGQAILRGTRQQPAASTNSFGKGIFTFRASGVSSKQ